jgi:hypothetical protein
VSANARSAASNSFNRVSAPARDILRFLRGGDGDFPVSLDGVSAAFLPKVRHPDKASVAKIPSLFV